MRRLPPALSFLTEAWGFAGPELTVHGVAYHRRHAARVLGRPDLRAQARRRGTAILRSIETNGWICGVPCGTATPSLMVGLAGIGYGLLRIAAPDQVPSVLTLEPAADPGPNGERRSSAA